MECKAPHPARSRTFLLLALLLAATLLAADARLWTRDKRLHAAATDLGVAWAPESH